ncbi:unnamed protein product [Schistosoma margrebowiei]|uniref:Uncharacterized protein n=1 Tax=Schistosoma margrebowiei TaxID=48269 RepID=A0A183MBS9_9TREM|nr:unnamed protein product [Schistosoma margrebowiei]
MMMLGANRPPLAPSTVPSSSQTTSSSSINRLIPPNFRFSNNHFREGYLRYIYCVYVLDIINFPKCLDTESFLSNKLSKPSVEMSHGL